MSNDYNDLSGEEYEALYARYLRDPGRLLVASGVALNKETRLLDLCSGSGLLVREAIAAGVEPGNIAAVEQSLAMVRSWWPKGPCQETVHVTHYYGADVRAYWLHEMLGAGGLFDLITCRQAVNYWWSPEAASLVCRHLAPGGVFVFNTFNTEPDESIRVREYIDGAHFVEVSYRVGDVVHHVQMREGMRPHVTSFRWISPVEFALDLDELVKTQMLAGWRCERDGTTSTYICRG